MLCGRQVLHCVRSVSAKGPQNHHRRALGVGTKRLLSPGDDRPIEVLETPTIVDPDALSAQDVPQSNPPMLPGASMEQIVNRRQPSPPSRQCADNLTYPDLGDRLTETAGRATSAHAEVNAKLSIRQGIRGFCVRSRAASVRPIVALQPYRARGTFPEVLLLRCCAAEFEYVFERSFSGGSGTHKMGGG